MPTTPDAHPVVPWLTPPRRAWLYRLTSAAVPLLAFYGLVAELAVPLWLAFAGAMIGTGTAALHTPTETVSIEDRLRDHDRGAVSWSTVFLGIIAIVLVLWALGEVPR